MPDPALTTCSSLGDGENATSSSTLTRGVVSGGHWSCAMPLLSDQSVPRRCIPIWAGVESAQRAAKFLAGIGKYQKSPFLASVDYKACNYSRTSSSAAAGMFLLPPHPRTATRGPALTLLPVTLALVILYVCDIGGKIGEASDCTVCEDTLAKSADRSGLSYGCLAISTASRRQRICALLFESCLQKVRPSPRGQSDRPQ